MARYFEMRRELAAQIDVERRDPIGLVEGVGRLDHDRVPHDASNANLPGQANAGNVLGEITAVSDAGRPHEVPQAAVSRSNLGSLDLPALLRDGDSPSLLRQLKS